MLYQQRAGTDGNGKVGVAYSNPSEGISSTAGKSMAWDDVVKNGENNAEFFIEFSTKGFTNIMLRFDIMGNDMVGAGISSYDVKYSFSPLTNVTNPGNVVGTIKDFSGGVSASLYNNRAVTTNGAGFTSVSIDLSSVSAFNDRPAVVIRFDDFSKNDAMRIDNFLITGIPEPSSALLLGLGLCGSLLRRKR